MAVWWSSSTMDEYTNNWDLNAVVRSCNSAITSSKTSEHFHHYPPIADDHHFMIFNEGMDEETSKTNEIHDELEELYKPFFSKPEQQVSQPSRAVAQSTTRSRRRKNQQKKVVCQVPVDDGGVASDKWAWRKYGQKPIKGSPYPRGYYRCSSSKACLARKQVERSCADPTMLVITYTAEHNHPAPTHRNSLAGTTRTKFKDIDQNMNSNYKTTTSSSNSSSIEDEFLSMSKEVNGDDGEDELEKGVNGQEDEDFVEQFFSSIWQVENNALADSGGS